MLEEYHKTLKHCKPLLTIITQSTCLILAEFLTKITGYMQGSFTMLKRRENALQNLTDSFLSLVVPKISRNFVVNSLERYSKWISQTSFRLTALYLLMA